MVIIILTEQLKRVLGLSSTYSFFFILPNYNYGSASLQQDISLR